MPSMTLTCCICNLPMRMMPTSKPQGEAAHNKCRISVGGLRTHGSSAYHAGCRCDVCRDAKREAMRRFSDKYQEKHGETHNVRWRREFKDKNGYWPQRGGGDWISPKLRQSIYDRDGLACYLCGDHLDRLAAINDPKAPTIDHVVPRSKGGSHELDNLKTCCRECNIQKADSMPADALLMT